MSDEHEQGTNPGGGLEEVATGGRQDRAEQWQHDDGEGSAHDDAPQDTAGQWVSEGGSSRESQDTAAQWYEESEGRTVADER